MGCLKENKLTLYESFDILCECEIKSVTIITDVFIFKYIHVDQIHVVYSVQ